MARTTARTAATAANDGGRVEKLFVEKGALVTTGSRLSERATDAQGTVLVAGLAISIPLIIFGSTLLLKVMERFPIIITLGAALLGVAISIHYYFSILREAVVRPTDGDEELAPLDLPFGTRFLIGALTAASIIGGLFVLFGR